MQSKLLIMTFLSVFIFCDSVSLTSKFVGNLQNLSRQVSAYFDVIVDRMEQLGSTKFVDASSLKVRRVDKDRQLFGKIIYKVSLDDSVTAEVLLYLKTTAGYVLMPYKISKPFCDFYNGDPYFYPELAAVSDYEVPCPCPFLNVRK